MKVEKVGFLDWWPWVVAGGLLILSWVAYIQSPDVVGMVVTERIFYFHFGAAIASGICFTILFVASLLYLWKRDGSWDALGAASAEVGVVFTAIVLVTGTLWGKAQWGIWWTWDPKLTTTLILWFLGVAYLLLREGMGEVGKRGTYSAVLGILTFVDIPIIFIASRIWSSIHPIVITGAGLNMSAPIIWAMVAGVVACLCLLVFLVGQRTAQGIMEAEIAILKERFRR